MDARLLHNLTHSAIVGVSAQPYDRETNIMSIIAFAALDLRAPGAKEPKINHFAIVDARDISDSPYLTGHDWLRLFPVTEETAAMPLTTPEEREAAHWAMNTETTPALHVGRLEREIGRLTVSYRGRKDGDRFTYAEPLSLFVSSYNYDDLTDAARGILNAAVTEYVFARMDELPNPTHTDDEARAEILSAARGAARHAAYTARRELLEKLGAQTYRSNERVSDMLRGADMRAAVIAEMAQAFAAAIAEETF